MVPCKFEEMEVRVYNKSKKHSSSDEDIAKYVTDFIILPLILL